MKPNRPFFALLGVLLGIAFAFVADVVTAQPQPPKPEGPPRTLELTDAEAAMLVGVLDRYVKAEGIKAGVKPYDLAERIANAPRKAAPPAAPTPDP